MADTRSLFGEAQALRRRAEELDALGRREEACAAYRRSGALYEEAGEFSLAGSMMGMLSHRLRDLGRISEACDALELSAAMHRGNSDNWEAARGLRQVASSFMVWGARGRYKALDKEARRLQDRARSGRTKSGDPGERIHALHEYALSRGHGWRGSRQARKALKEALLIDAEANAGQRECIVSALALIEHCAGNPERARAYHQEAIELFEKAGKLQQAGDDLFKWGQMESRAGNHDDARRVLDRALAIKRKAGIPQSEAFTLMVIGDVEARRKRYGESRTAYREALALFRKISDRANECLALGGMARLESEAGNLDRARELCAERRELYSKDGEWHGEGYALRDWGDMERDAGDLETAEDLYKEARDLFGGYGDLQGEGQMLGRLGRINLNRNPCSAARYYLEAAKRYRELGNTDAFERAMKRHRQAGGKELD